MGRRSTSPVFDAGYFDLTPLERIKRFQDSIGNDTEHRRFVDPLFASGQLRVVEAESKRPGHGRVVFEFDNPDHWSNFSGNLHGGAHATLHDIITSNAIIAASRSDFWPFSGVTRTLNVTYLRPAPSDEPLIIEAETVHIGKQLALVYGVIKRKSDGAVVSTCEHNKVNTDPRLPAKL